MKTRLRTLVDRANGHPMAKAVVALIVLVLVAPVILQPTATTLPSHSPGSSSPVAATSPSAPPTSPEPTDPPEPWEDLVLGPIELMAEITPDREDSAGVATTTSFRLRSLDGTPALELAAGVLAEPPVDFRIVEGATKTVALLEPVSTLIEGQTYRFRLVAPDGALGGTWAFQTQRPLQVVHTLPGDESDEVPVDTGIEVTFDQDGTTAFEPHFRIEPSVAGSFEAHGRTWAFVPERPLATATAYRVTIEPGVAITGSKQILETAVSFRFETVAQVVEPEAAVDFAAPMAGVRLGEHPALLVNVRARRVSMPSTLPVRIYRLPSLGATVDAAETLTGPDRWLRASGAGLVSTEGLVLVSRLDATLIRDPARIRILSIPFALDAGSYLVVVPRQGRTAQMLLQVSDLGAYALSTDTSTVAWVNDLASVQPVARAIVATADGDELGSTDGNGVARFRTPASLRPEGGEWWEDARPNIVTVRAPGGRWLVVGLGSPVSWLDGPYDSAPSQASEPDQRWWRLLNTDRSQYRQTDTIHAWGLVRARDDGSLPRDVELRLYPIQDEDQERTGRVPIVTVPVRLSPRGVFAADLPIAALPRDSYSLALYAGDIVVASNWLQVVEIRKPSYRLDVAADRYAYLDGETISLTIQATFFDGSAVPGIELRVESDDSAGTLTVTTDATGTAHATLAADFADNRPSGWTGQSIHVTPLRPEEGEISGGTDVAVFPSTAWISSTARLSGTTLVIDGELSRVAFSGIDAARAAGTWDWGDDEVIAGRPISGHEVTASVVQHHEVRSRTGTSYDYLEKRVVVVYDYATVKRQVGTFTVRTDADGTFRISVPIDSRTDEYEIDLSSTDAAGRRVVTDEYARAEVRPSEASLPSFLVRGMCGAGTGSMVVGLDEEARVTLHDGDGGAATDGRFLFIVGSRGLREVTPSGTSSYARVLGDADLPGFTIRAIQVTGQGYVAADVHVRVDVADLTIEVRLDPDRRRYAPGDRVTVGVKTLGPDGRPIAADVVVQGVDEKLFAIGAAHEADVLGELHAPVGDGFLQSFASHRIPNRPNEGGCGATGGGDRSNFGDVVISELVRTGRDGRGTVSFDLLDDLTSWRLTGIAVTGGLHAGSGSVLIPVSLPFFVETVVGPEYLVGDSPVLRVRAYGEALQAGDPVRFTVSAPSLGLAETTVSGRAFEAVRVPLGSLPLGEHRVRVAGEGPRDGQTDAVIRVIRAVPSRLSGLVTRYDTLTPGYEADGGEGLTTYAVVDAGRGSLLAWLVELATASSARFDRQAAAEVARRLLIDEYGFDPNELPGTGFDASRYEQGGIALLPYAGRDPELSAMAALVVPELVSTGPLRNYLRNHADEETPTRESRLVVLAGLAALGEDVLIELREMAGVELTIRERLWLALGLVAAGDEHGARAIERDLLKAHGEQFGPWVRLAVGGNIEDTLDAARLLMVLSARLGEPFARDVARYLTDHETEERSLALEQLAYVRAMLDRLPRAAARFAWTVAGERQEIELGPGRTFTLVLTAEQRATLTLERLAGHIAVVSSWRGSDADLPREGRVSITRSITPATGSDDRLARVDIHVAFQTLATVGCWQLTDLAPSGLAPIERSWEWPDDVDHNLQLPYRIDGQRVAWCASPDDRNLTFTYVARVVTPGTYTWEPSVIQLVNAPEVGATTAGAEFSIR